uniref:Uncharacterized protein n=1 Tax=Arundo donax TaxID=35708 RepID=A0A0A9BZZ6_ARUDO
MLNLVVTIGEQGQLNHAKLIDVQFFFFFFGAWNHQTNTLGNQTADQDDQISKWAKGTHMPSQRKKKGTRMP